MHARQLMTSPPVVVREDATLEMVARLMIDRGIGCVLVVDAVGMLRGIITESDFVTKERAVPFSLYRAPQLFGEWVGKDQLEALYRDGRTHTAGQIMTPTVVTVTEEASLDDVLEPMMRHDITRVPVVRGRIPVGVIARHDLLRLMLDERAPHTTSQPNTVGDAAQ